MKRAVGYEAHHRMHALPAGHIQRERVAAELLLLREKLECGRGEHEYAVEQVRAHEILRHNMSSRGNGNADTDADAERSTKWVGRGEQQCERAQGRGGGRR